MKARLLAAVAVAVAAVLVMGSSAGVAAPASPGASAGSEDAGSVGTAAAATVVPPLVNQQLVTASLDASGLPLQAQIVNRIVATNVPVQEVKSQTSTNNVRNLENAKAPSVQGNSVVYTVGGPGQTSAATQATFGKPMPVALHAKYSTPGEGAQGIDPTTVGGRSGDMTVHYTATNTVAKVEPITYRNAAGVSTTEQQPVFAPFVGTVLAVLAPGVALTDPGNAVVNTTAGGQTSLLWNLVLYPPLGNYTQEMAFGVRSDDLQVPEVTMEVVPVANAQDPAVGFSANLLSQSVTGNKKLADGLSQLNDSALKLADGAAQLSSGQQQSASAAVSAEQGSAKITKGAAGVTSGAKSLGSGASTLSDGATKLGDGATKLSDGATALSKGLDELAAGLVGAEAGANKLAVTVQGIAVLVGNPTDQRLPVPDLKTPYAAPTTMSLLQGIWLVEDIITKLLRPLALSVAADSALTRAGLLVVVPNLQSLNTKYCGLSPTIDPLDCTKLQLALGAATAAQTTSKNAAVNALLLAGGLTLVYNPLLKAIEQAVIKISAALLSDPKVGPSVYGGLVLLQDGLATSVVAGNQLAAGGRQLSLAGQAVGSGGQDLAAGNAKLSTGAQSLADGAKQLTDGSRTLTNGLGSLADGSQQLASGGQGLAQGASDLQDQGTATILNQVVDSSSQPALADAYLSAASARSTEAAPYPAPEGAVARVAYSFTLTPPGSEGAPTPAAIIIGALFLLALAMLAVIRIRRPVDPIAAAGGFAPPPAPADPPS
ncbi:MAG: hypothetical protein WCP28_13015, partial [Actinomycetes bacterium]